MSKRGKSRRNRYSSYKSPGMRTVHTTVNVPKSLAYRLPTDLYAPRLSQIRSRSTYSYFAAKPQKTVKKRFRVHYRPEKVKNSHVSYSRGRVRVHNTVRAQMALKEQNRQRKQDFKPDRRRRS